MSELLPENIVFNSPILTRPITGREVIAAIFAQSSSTRGSGTYTAELKLDERTTFFALGQVDHRRAVAAVALRQSHDPSSLLVHVASVSRTLLVSVGLCMWILSVRRGVLFAGVLRHIAAGDTWW